MKVAKLDKKDQIIEQLNQEIERLERQIDEQAKIIATQSERLAILEPLEAKVVELEKTIEYLNAQLGRDSSDSSLPPSRDLKTPKPSPESLRDVLRPKDKKNKRKQGGQPGHKGANIKLLHEPNRRVQHWPTECEACPNFVECSQNAKVESRRYIIQPRVDVDVIEHQRMKMVGCARGMRRLTGTFPEKIKAPIQYDDVLIAIVVVLSVYGAVSVQRIQEILRGMYGIQISTGTIQTMIEDCAALVRPTVETDIKGGILEALVANFDETSTKVKGVKYWIHVAATKLLTYMTIHRKRGAEGTDANGVMPDFRGIAVHDCWKVYFGYLLCQHAVCCAHLLRELKYLMKNLPDRKWCRLYFDLLLYMKKIKERNIAKGLKQVSAYHLKKFTRMYADIMALAHQECPADPPPPKNSIEAKKELPLIKRLERLESSVTLFMRNFDVPFDNNEAERAIRCVRIKTKSAGGFRGNGGEDYCTLMSYINTGWKHGVNAFKALSEALAGNFQVIFGEPCPEN